MIVKEKEEKTFVDKVVHISRVAKVVKGGRRFSFSALWSSVMGMEWSGMDWGKQGSSGSNP